MNDPDVPAGWTSLDYQPDDPPDDDQADLGRLADDGNPNGE